MVADDVGTPLVRAGHCRGRARAHARRPRRCPDRSPLRWSGVRSQGAARFQLLQLHRCALVGLPGRQQRHPVVARPGNRAGAQRKILSESPDATTVALALPPSPEGEYYVFRVEAWKGGRLVGDLYAHDSGTHSWNYRFRVQDASVPRWAYFGAGGGLLLLLLAARRGLREA